MTQRDIEIAQFLHYVYRRSQELYKAVDEDGLTGHPYTRLVENLAGITGSAEGTFLTIAGRLARDVDEADLDTENPAEWVKAHKAGEISS